LADTTMPYIKMNHNDWKQNILNVYVIPKDSYSRKFMLTSVSAINELSNILKMETHNDKAWGLRIIVSPNSPNFLQTLAYPKNIQVELKRDGGDCMDAGGWWHDTKPIEKIFNYRANIEVFTNCLNLEQDNYKKVYGTTIHEMLHGLGLGHAWYEQG